MIHNIDPVKSFLVAISSVTAGTWYNSFCFYVIKINPMSVNTAFQHAAWTVAILAGIVSIINGIRQWLKPKLPRQHLDNPN